MVKTIHLTPNEVQHFVNVASKCDFDIDIAYNRYAVDAKSLEGTELTLTHLNLLDDTAEGVKSDENKIFSVQYHPESAPGPQDSAYLFDKFIDLMEKEAD